MTYDKGDLVRIEGQFRDIDGNLADPTNVSLRLKAPGFDAFAYTYLVGPVIVKEAVGVFRADIEITSVGKWRYKWTGTGALFVTEEGSFFVRPSSV